MISSKLLIFLAYSLIFSSAEKLDVCNCNDSCIEDTCVGKMFILTPGKGTFDRARGMCLALGGDLVQETVGISGKQYHNQIQAITKAAWDGGLYYIWLGISDSYDEGRWRYISSGEDFDETTAAFGWGKGYGNSGSDWNYGCTNGDFLRECHNTFIGYGLCEISANIC